MCTTNCREKVRQLDAFSQPVTLAYKQKKVFNSACGGAMTLLFAFLILGYLIQAWVKIFVAVEFTQHDTCDYVSYFHNGGEVFEMDALKYNLAM